RGDVSDVARSCDLADRISVEGKPPSADEVHCVALDLFARLRNGYGGCGLNVVSKELDRKTSQLAPMLVQIKLPAMQHFFAFFGNRPGQFEGYADLECVVARSSGVRGGQTSSCQITAPESRAKQDTSLGDEATSGYCRRPQRH